uniref:Uncharacterized protein n=1 Tax=Acrobeloides nanus TaxID=290746 RepID=A0A914CUQ4_9BILA
MNSAYHIEYLCDDLIGNQRVYDDNFLFATHVIERLLENRNVDLLAVAPYSNFTTTIHKLESLIGFNSASFKTICAHEDLFERFLFAFASMVKWKFVQDTHYFRETAYAYFLSSYLDNFLPTTDQKLTSVKNSDWFVVNPNSSAVVNSPLKLLRPEVIESSFASEFTYVPTFRNLYPKLYQFINHLIRFLTTLDTWPNVMQLVTLKHIMEHYYKFLVSETNDRDFMSFKLRLRNKPPFFHWLHDFLRRMLEDWPTDWSYITIVELWQLLVCPQNLFQDENKLRQFMSSSSSTYIDLIDIIIIRVIEADMLSPSLGPFMDYLIEEMFSEANVRLLEKFEVPMCDYLLIVREKIQVTYENEKAKSVLQTVSKNPSQGTLSAIFGFCQNRAQTIPHIRLD